MFSNTIPGETYNDLAVVIDRQDIEQLLLQRPDFDTQIGALGRAVAACVADYARRNPAGVNDQRCPGPRHWELPITGATTVTMMPIRRYATAVFPIGSMPAMRRR